MRRRYPSPPGRTAARSSTTVSAAAPSGWTASTQ
jgi:hypothetical protein